MLCDRPPLTFDIRHVSISSNGTAAARNVGDKLLLSSAEMEDEDEMCENLAISICCQFRIFTYLSTPTAHRTPCTRPQSAIVFTIWQTNRFNMCVKTNASIIIRCHFNDRNVIAIWPIVPKFGMHYNCFDAKTSFKHVKFF